MTKNGAKWERKYRNWFNNRTGFKAIRIPSSGSSSKDDLPDLHVWFNGVEPVEQFALEIKALKDANRLDNGEIDALRRYADDTGAVPLVLAHVKHDGGYVFKIDDLHSTEKGYTLRKGRDFEGARTVDDFAGRVQDRVE